MRSRPFRLVPALVAVMLLLVPGLAAAADVTPQDIAINSIWVVVAAILVLFMQAGFAMLEVGLSRMKNAGAVMGKILINLSISFLMFWAVGFAIGFGTGNDFIGSSGWFMDNNNPTSDFASLAYSNTNFEATYFFQVVFCAVSLAIVFGSMLDRTKFIGYVIFGIVFAGFIYPTVAHWTWGGGWLLQDGFQDFAGSSIVHLQGALAATAGALVLGPRIGKFRDGKSVPIPGHSVPLTILGVIILWVGWMGFNPGSFLNAVGYNFADVAVNTNLAAAAGVIGATIGALLMFKTLDVTQMGNGALAGLVAITAPCAFVDPWGAVVIGFIAGIIVPPLVLAVEKLKIDDPVGAIPVHFCNGLWGVIAVGLFANGNAASAGWNGMTGKVTGLFYGGGVSQLLAQFAEAGSIIVVAVGASLLFFTLLAKLKLLRSKPSDEIMGLDMPEMGALGYNSVDMKMSSGRLTPQMPVSGKSK